MAKEDSKFTSQFDKYMKMADESEGFDVCPMSGRLCGGIQQFRNVDSYGMRRAVEIAKFAVDDYNNKNKDSNVPVLEFDSIVKVNGQPVGGYIYYITFRVRVPFRKRPKFYQTKVWSSISRGLIIRIFREKPRRPSVRRKKSKKKEAKPGPSSRHHKIKKEKVKPLYIPKGAFFSFMNDLRKLPELDEMKYCDVTTLASKAWRSMSPEEKEKYCLTRGLTYEDIAVFMAASE